MEAALEEKDDILRQIKEAESGSSSVPEKEKDAPKADVE
jgi:hypothetical protein